MIRQLPESEGSTIGVEVSGQVDMEQEKHWIAIFDQLIEEHGSINVLVVLAGRIDFDLDAAYTDLKWTFKHIKNMHKLAIVSESRVLACLVAADSPFGKMAGLSEKHFDSSQLQAAWLWVKE